MGFSRSYRDIGTLFQLITANKGVIWLNFKTVCKHRVIIFIERVQLGSSTKRPYTGLRNNNVCTSGFFFFDFKNCKGLLERICDVYVYHIAMEAQKKQEMIDTHLVTAQ